MDLVFCAFLCLSQGAHKAKKLGAAHGVAIKGCDIPKNFALNIQAV
jgi:hypothetical protein